jgi:hypothetical protein
MNRTGIPLWFILRQVRVEKGESKIIKLLTDDSVRIWGADPHEYAEPVYWRYLKIYKTLYADINEVNCKFIRKYRTRGNFCINSSLGVGFIKVDDEGSNFWTTPFGVAQEKSGLSYEHFKTIVVSGANQRDKYMQTQAFKKLEGETRTLKILTEEMIGVLHGKARVSREQSYRTTKRTRVNCDAV